MRYVQMHVSHLRPGRDTRPSNLLTTQVAQETLHVERQRSHLQPAVRTERPFLARAIPVDLDPVTVGIGQVDRLADTVVGKSLHDGPTVHQTAKRLREIDTCRDENREVIQPRNTMHSTR